LAKRRKIVFPPLAADRAVSTGALGHPDAVSAKTMAQRISSPSSWVIPTAAMQSPELQANSHTQASPLPLRAVKKEIGAQVHKRSLEICDGCHRRWVVGWNCTVVPCLVLRRARTEAEQHTASAADPEGRGQRSWSSSAIHSGSLQYCAASAIYCEGPWVTEHQGGNECIVPSSGASAGAGAGLARG
jgi:hypothetical protein